MVVQLVEVVPHLDILGWVLEITAFLGTVRDPVSIRLDESSFWILVRHPLPAGRTFALLSMLVDFLIDCFMADIALSMRFPDVVLSLSRNEHFASMLIS